MELGYEFHWKPFAQPVLTYPSGKKITLRVDSYVPILDAEVYTTAHHEVSKTLFVAPARIGIAKPVSPVAPLGVGGVADASDAEEEPPIEDGPPREDDVEAVGGMPIGLDVAVPPPAVAGGGRTPRFQATPSACESRL